MTSNEQNDEFNKRSIFLCMSGGGFRATLFHYGCLKRLKELGILDHVFAMSATSGGSIAATLLHQCHTNEGNKRGVFTYDWEKFEQKVLRLVTHGALKHVTKLVRAYIFYILALLFSFFLYPNGIGTEFFWIGLACLLLGIADFKWIFYAFALIASLTLYVFFSDGTVADYLWQRLAVSCLALGFVFHCCLALDILKMTKKTSDMRKKVAEHFTDNQKSYSRHTLRESNQRRIKMLFQPSLLRIETMNALAFECKTLNMLDSDPKIFLTAVNLNDGNEMVFNQTGYIL